RERRVPSTTGLHAANQIAPDRHEAHVGRTEDLSGDQPIRTDRSGERPLRARPLKEEPREGGHGDEQQRNRRSAQSRIFVVDREHQSRALTRTPSMCVLVSHFATPASPEPRRRPRRASVLGDALLSGAPYFSETPCAGARPWASAASSSARSSGDSSASLARWAARLLCSVPAVFCTARWYSRAAL